MNTESPTPTPSSNKPVVPLPAPEPRKMSLSVDLRVVTVVLLLVIGGMFYFWKPWHVTTTDAQTVTVTGEAKLTDKPDQFEFTPLYKITKTSNAEALAAVTKKNNEVVAKLKELGVESSKIKTDADGNQYHYYYDATTKDGSYTLQMTVITNTPELTQKVQNYLVTTDPTGAISPTASFSDAKRKTLELKARDVAAKDARARADQMAKNLGFKVSKVKSVSDGSGFGRYYPLTMNDLATPGTSSANASSDSSELTLQPGENDLNYSITVQYFIR